MLSGTLALAAASTGDVTHADEYDGIIGWVLDLITRFGEVGVGLALAIESVFPPIPSELILPVAGFLSYQGHMNFWLAMFFAALGSMAGAYILYYVGYFFGRERTRWLFEKLPLLELKDFERSEKVFARWGGVAVLAGRCLPLVRSAISVPAGIEKMPFWKFTGYTLVGSVVWNGIWIGLGFAFGPAIEPILNEYSGLLSKIVVGIIGVLFLWFVVQRTMKIIRNRRNGGGEDQNGGAGHSDTMILRRVQ
ncbi:DedA family protein [Glycomyces artemisiae]|uniref:Membrane protein DedA with SNARE-associated domain n=1 Tax=Glycomyces artemisiae TaxID=1076443 RepID=A0A2T0US40_9ACTN|nr:DedA family protein [Glycomyces artemisiae]PRY60730.1 membrane protein DedA with SNARE-associated domain [Glycomyces artemisiae]